MDRWRKIFLVSGLLLLGACSSTTFVYNRLDFLLPWYVDDYAELNGHQQTYLDELLAPFLRWHRTQELPSYVKVLEDIEDGLNEPQTSAHIAAVFVEFEAAWLRLESEALDWLLDLGAQLSDEQIQGFLNELWEQQEEFEEEYLERTDTEFYQDSYDNLVDNAKDYLGILSEEQRDLLRASSHLLLRSDRAWLQERTDWLKQLTVLLERKPQWRQRVREAVAARRENPSPGYVRIYEHNLNVIYDLIAQLLNSRSELQDEHLRDKLSVLREDLETLIVQGKDAVTAPPD